MRSHTVVNKGGSLLKGRAEVNHLFPVINFLKHKRNDRKMNEAVQVSIHHCLSCNGNFKVEMSFLCVHHNLILGYYVTSYMLELEILVH